jgi:hypothetical protein
MKKLTGWQKAGLVAGAGCVTIILLVATGLLGAAYWARSTMAELGDAAPTQIDRTIPLATLTPEAVPGPPPEGPRTPGDGPSEVRLDLEEGRFTIEPGAPGEQVLVTGTFSPALHEITEDHEAGADGRRRTTIRFRSKAPAWVRILSGIGIGNGDNQPRITIRLPEGTPMDLALRVAMGESRIDLGRLSVRDLDLDLSMGEHRIDFGAPVVEGVRRLQLNASMGNVSVSNLGNARPQTVDLSGRMGNVTADLGGAWEAGSTAQLSFTQSMGEVRLSVPADVRLETDIRSGTDDAAPPGTGGPEAAGPDAPVLRVRVSSSMGNARIDRYTR